MISSIINFARIIGSFVCFQWEEATFSVEGEYFPVCSGCFGIYLGSVVALSTLPHYEKISKKLFSAKYGLPMVLPMTIYWILLNIQQNTGLWIIPAIKELYSFFGFLVGVAIANVAYNLKEETAHANKISKVGKHFWFLTVALIITVFIAFAFYGTQRLSIFTASLIFILGFFGLTGVILIWIFAFIASSLNKELTNQSKNSRAILSVLTIFTCFLVFQVLIFENRPELFAVGLFFGIITFGLLSYTLRTFTWRDLGIVRKGWKMQLIYGVVIGTVLYLAFLVYHFIFSGFNGVVVSSLGVWEVFVIFAIVASEELFFRGYMITMLERQISTELSCLISSIFFTLYHYKEIIKNLMGLSNGYYYFEFEYLFVFLVGGLLLAFLFIKKRSLVMPIVVHFVWNMLVITASSQ